LIKIKGHLDLFSGIGGFSLGLKQAGVEPDWIGFSDIDKYSNKLFKRRFKDAEELGSITGVSYESLKGQRIDLLTGGFPCQAFSIAGKRKGFDDTRGTLFFDIKRVLQDYIRNGKPIPCILLENVKGLLNHDNGRTFATIYGILSNLDYTLECQLVNTKWWLPQNRERIFIFGRYNGNTSGRKVFPIYGCSEKDSRIQGQHTNTITARYEAGATGSYIVESKLNTQKGKLNQIGTIGKDNQANRVYNINGISKTLTDGGGGGAKIGLYNYKSRIRRLTPIECERLQGFPDNWTDGQSDTQRYKQCGNAVSVPVTEAIFRKIYND
jgi:DNA (cytosine-5)-methyltransferase 1